MPYNITEEIPCSATGNISNVDKPMASKKKSYKDQNIADGVGGKEGRRILAFKEWIEEAYSCHRITDMGPQDENSPIDRYAIWKYNPRKSRHEVIDTGNDHVALAAKHNVDLKTIVKLGQEKD